MPNADKRVSRPLIADTFTVADAIIQDAWTYVSPNSSNYGQVATFVIPRSVGSIYELALEVVFPTEAGVSICPYASVRLVEGYTLSVGGSLIQTDGESMFMTRQSFLTNDSRTFYAAQAGGTSSASISIASGDARQFLILDYPGGYSVNNSGSTNNHDDSYGLPFPLNKCNQDMTITINLAQRASIVTAGTSTLQPTLRLHYQAIWSDSPSFNAVNNSGSAEDIFIPGYIAKKSTVQQSIGATPINIPLIGQIVDGQLLKLLVKLSNASQITAKNYYAGLQLDTMRLNVAGTDFYRADNSGEAIFKDGNNRRQAPFTDGAQNPVYYEIWGSTDTYLIANDEYHAIDIYRQNPNLVITAPTPSGVTQLDYISVTKCVFRIDKWGTVVMFTSTSGGA
jgi:hypothetical protein